MRKRTSAGIAVALLVSCSGAWLVARWRATGSAAAPSVVPNGEFGVQEDLDGSPAAKASGAATTTPAERRALDAGSPDQPAATGGALRGRVTASGAAVSGAQIAVQYAPADSFNTLDHVFGGRIATVARARTDAAGEFAVDVARGQLFQLDVTAAGLACARVGHCTAGEFVEVRMERAATVLGTVKRRDDGSPVVGARLTTWLRARGDRVRVRGARRETQSDGFGRFRFDELEPGARSIEVERHGDTATELADIELAAGELRELDLTVVDGATIRGHVTDAESARGIEDAEIGQGWALDSPVKTDADGAYEYRGFSIGYLQLVARAPGYGTLEQSARSSTNNETLSVVDFALRRAHSAHGRVVDEHGSAIADAYVAAAAFEFGTSIVNQRTDWISTSSDAGGAFELASLRADLHHTLFVRKEGFGTVAFEFPASEANTSSLALGDIVLAPASRLCGSVADTARQPIADQLVNLRGINRDRNRLSGDTPFDVQGTDLYVAARETRTDSRGRFCFEDLAAGDYEVFAFVAENHDVAATARATVERAATAGDVELVFDRGLSIQGVVRTSDGGPLPQVYVSVDPQGDGRSADCEVERGMFDAQGLGPITYTLTAYPYASPEDTRAGRVFLTTRLENVAAGARDVVIELRAGRYVIGRVLDADGAPVLAAVVLARDAHGVELDTSMARDDGAFEIRVAAGERCELVAQPPQLLAPDGAEVAPDPSTFAVVPTLDGERGEVVLRLNWRR